MDYKKILNRLDFWLSIGDSQAEAYLDALSSVDGNLRDWLHYYAFEAKQGQKMVKTKKGLFNFRKRKDVVRFLRSYL